ncbi:uncharacterized protein, partial [Argopecten irradians]|uniref:uncharacterized protein n=1 Tax=Argopecten irradians TaxID=31199 RepID=UPI00371913A5
MPSIAMKENKDSETILVFPIRGELTLTDLRDAFPALSSLRYQDHESEQINHILCRNGVFQEPEGGWEKSGRMYYTVIDNQGGVDRSRSLFEAYQRRISNRQRPRVTNDGNPKKKESDKTSLSTMITISHGHFTGGRFSKISVVSLSGLGGNVVVGPFSKSGNTSDLIKKAAFEKFRCVNRIFRSKYSKLESVCLVYGDGSEVVKLPDNSADFSIEGYRNFIDPRKRFDRLRLFLCAKEQVIAAKSNFVELISASSSSSDNLPELSRPNTHETDDSNNDTLPLVKQVTFRYAEKELKEEFPNNAAVS